MDYSSYLVAFLIPINLDKEEYTRIIEYYHFAIEERKEENLQYIVQCLNITMDDIDLAQERYMNADQSTQLTDESELDKYVVPSWLTYDRARQIYEELKEQLKHELESRGFEGHTSIDST